MSRRSIAALGVGAALVLGACATDRELTEPDPIPVTAERLTEALVDADDLTPGYTVVEDKSTPMSTELITEHDCDDRLKDLEPKEEVSRTFAGSDTTFSHTVAYFPGAGVQVERLMREIAADCASLVVDGRKLAIRTGPLDFGVLSDDTFAIRVEVEPDEGTIQERDLILMRAGDLIGVLRLNGPRPSDKALLDGAVRVAIGYLGLVHDDTT